MVRGQTAHTLALLHQLFGSVAFRLTKYSISSGQEFSKPPVKNRPPWTENSVEGELVLNVDSGASPPAPPPGISPAALAFLEATRIHTEDAYVRFIRMYPASEEAKKALALIELLRDEASWRIALEKHTIAGYTEYLVMHGSGLHVGEARQRTVDMAEDDESWREARILDSVPGYEAYNAEHPAGLHGDEARRRIATLSRNGAASKTQLENVAIKNAQTFFQTWSSSNDEALRSWIEYTGPR